MKIRTLASGASVRLVDEDDRLGPEANAMIQALYSRSAESVEVHLRQVRDKGSASFMRSYYVGYNHKSIADCGSTTLFFEDVSLLAAKAIQDWPLYSGQETSTRYLDMGTRPVVDPVGTPESAAHLQRWMAFYSKAITAVPDEVRRRYPRRETDPEDKYQAAVKARAFDVCRGFLPAGITTQLSWHSNLRQMHDHLAWLRKHPLVEVRALAETAVELLAESYPASGFNSTAGAGVSGVTEGQAARDAWYSEVASEVAYDVDQHEPMDRVMLTPNFSYEWLDQYRDVLQSRPRGAVLPHYVNNVGQFRVCFDLDFGSFRDIQRHRNGVCRMPLLDGSLGFEGWYVDELPESLRVEARDLVRSQQGRVSAVVVKNGEIDQFREQYYQPIGEKVRCDLSYGLPALLYVLELRSQKTVHPTLRKRILETAEHVRNALPPYVTMHIEKDPDDWNLRRGQQDIRRVGT
jgi:thymidylate synthase ThyX